MAGSNNKVKYSNSASFFTFLCVLYLSCSVIKESYSLDLRNVDAFRVTTESSDTVETFDPLEWIPKSATQQVEITQLKLETRTKLRYARTRISANLKNKHDKPLQASFRITLPHDAFFTVFKLRRGKSPKDYTALIERKDKARKLFHFAHTKTNGSVSAAIIESTSTNNEDLLFYDMKFTLGPKTEIVSFLIFERQLERVDRSYCDQMHVYPIEVSMVKSLEISVDVEEYENITKLGCSDDTKGNYDNCDINMKYKGKKRNAAEFSWRGRNVTSKSLERRPFGFCYELEQTNTTSAVVIFQTDGSFHFMHLFVPENLPVIKKHITFLLDVSDSMHGKKLEQLKWSMIEILDDLKPDDYFSIITFSNEVTVWSHYIGERSKCPIPFEASLFKGSASNFIQTMSANGVTNIYKGLLKAFDLIKFFSPLNNEICEQKSQIKAHKKYWKSSKLPENVQSMILFLSDGNATTGLTNHRALLEFFQILNHASMAEPIQIHTIAYGSDANVPFLKALSLQNGGVMKIINEDSGAGVEIVNFYSEISSQVLTDIQNSYSSTKEELVPPGVITLPLPNFLPDGGEILMVQNLRKEDNQTLSINQTALSLRASNFTWNTKARGRNGPISFETPVFDCYSLEKEFTKCWQRIDVYLRRLQVYQLLKKFLTQDMFVQESLLCPKSFEKDEIYNDNLVDSLNYFDFDDSNQCVNPYKEKVIELAEEFGFITPYTSFILTTDVHVDIGLLENSSSSPSHADDGDEDDDGETNIAHEDNVLSAIDNKLIKSPYIEAVESPPAVQNLDYSSNTSSFQRNSSPNDSITQWFTKSIRNFALSIMNKLFNRKKFVDDYDSSINPDFISNVMIHH